MRKTNKRGRIWKGEYDVEAGGERVEKEDTGSKRGKKVE